MTGGCNGCDGGSCGGKPDMSQGYGADFQPSRTNRSQSKSDDFLPLMKNQPKPKGDDTDLEEQCPHYHFGTIQRLGCETCLRLWALAHDYEACLEKVEELKEKGKSVASKRLAETMKDLVKTKPDWKTRK